MNKLIVFDLRFVDFVLYYRSKHIFTIITNSNFTKAEVDFNITNSNITDCLVAKPTRYLGINGFSMFNAVCMVITPPTKNEINATIPSELMTRSSISFRINFT